MPLISETSGDQPTNSYEYFSFDAFLGGSGAVTVLRDGKEQTLQVPLYEDADMKSISESSEVLFLLGIAARAEVPDENGQTSLKVVRSGGFKSVEVKDGFFQTIGHSFVYSYILALSSASVRDAHA